MKNRHVILLLVTLVFLAACTKKRDPSFPEGTGQDLLAIADYDSRNEFLQTAEPKGNVFYTSAEFDVDKDSTKVKIVNYTSDAPFFPKDIELAGVANTKYKLIYKLTPQKLIIFRNSAEDVLAPEEKLSAEMETDKSFSVPLLSYPVTGFYRIQIAKDDNGDKTTRLREESVQNKDEATHFRISRVPEIIAFQDRPEQIVKADYFDGVWYTSSVVAKASEEASAALGRQVSYDSKWESADKIQFVRTQDSVLGLNANYDKRIKIIDDMDKLNNLATVVKFPAKYFDSEATAKQESVNYKTAKNKLRNWKERKWAAINFKDASSEMIDAFTHQQGGKPIMTNFRMTDDFFMVSFQYKGVRLTVSYLKESSVKKLAAKEYAPKTYFYNDFRHFGFFYTSKKSLATIEKHRNEHFELNRFINRFHPEDYKNSAGQSRRRIRFFMTDDSTTEIPLINTVKESLKAWDFAFKQAGLEDVDIYLDESQRVALGDIRYNSINLVRTLTSSSLFGYGPSIADPDTGQIVSATTNVHITSIRDSLVGALRNYIRHSRNELQDKYPLGSKVAASSMNSPDVQTMARASVEQAVVNKDESSKSAVKPASAAKLGFEFGKSQCDFSSTSGNLQKDVEQSPACTQLRDFVKIPKKDVKSNCDKNDKNLACLEMDSLINCAEALLPEKLKATILHELGHNIGLRHNFAASTDETNFTRKFDEKSINDLKNYSCPTTQSKSKEILARSSSVMEYTDLNEDRLTFVGPYDVEAIRYGYASKLMDSTCNVQPLDIEKSVDDNLVVSKIEKLPMKFCTDDHVGYKMDPLCQMQDSGANPLDIVRNLKNQYNVMFATQNFKHDRARTPSPNGLASFKNEYIFVRMKLIYEQWRLYLTEFVGQKNSALEIYDSKAYSKILLDMKADKKYGPYYDAYFEATREIFQFLLDIAFLPDRYCLVKTPSGRYDLFELEELIKNVQSRFNLREISCTDKNIASELKTKGEFVREVGFYYENQKIVGDSHSTMIDILNTTAAMGARNAEGLDNFESYWDIIGTRLEKDSAKDTLVKREAVGFLATQRALKFNLMDEPDLRERFINKLVNRLLYGIPYSDIFPEAAQSAENQNFYFEKWGTEMPHIRRIWASFNLYIKQDSDNDFTAQERGKQWNFSRIEDRPKAESYPEEQRFETKSGSYVVALNKENTVTIALLKRLKELLKMQKDEPEKFNSKRQDYESQIILITFIFGIVL